MARLMHRERRRQSMRKVVLAMLCMMRVMNTTLMLYMFIMDFMMVRRKPCIRVNPNVYQNQVDALNRLVRGDDKDCHDQLRNCLGALDGTFVTVHPPAQDRARYRSRKGDYATNVLGVCSRNLRFIYALSGWEGSATDSRVLRNALVRPHGLRIPQGHYYLVDAGYTNGPGFREEYFNMNHASARNMIERCFGVLKMRFAILRSCSYYPMRTQCRIVTACCLIHNLIKREMAVDPIEIEYTAWEQANVHIVPPDDYIDTIEPTTQWTEMRDNLATTMYNNWLTHAFRMESKPNGGTKPSKAKGKGKQSRRIWTVREEEGLLACMLEEFKDGSKWGAENGFKSGFFGAVEILFHKMFPGTTIRANPNIESKVKNWKEKYGLLADMRKLSGFSWNHDTHSVIVDSEDVWDEYVNFHPKASGMNGRVFPMFLSWQLLFGKDRATGEMAEDAAEIMEDASGDVSHQPSYEESFVGNNEFYIPRYTDGRFVFGGADFIDLSTGGSQNTSPPTPTSNANATTPPTHANATTTTRPLKKAKKLTRVEAKQDSLTQAFGSYMSDTREVMEKLVNAVSSEHRLSERRQGVFVELEKLNLEIEDMLTANAMILATEEKLDEFYSAPERYRQQWVGMLLQGKLNQK
ncbi:hypothetical protein Acr_00g0100280 [Actinidia rufa]|uniref:Uncharacterized protein n=1 Tax=Actinidia rufa TaxID=165716 RepID=A0A7J0DZT1_9ERIC|nr:hypothetical protein Acr_00g0100280 [Actinidia rufa]